MIRRLITATALSLTLTCVPVASDAQGHIDIVQIWQSFIASRVAAADCNGIDATNDKKFLANLMAVSIRATEAIQQKNPTAPQADIVSKMKTAGDNIHDKVDADVKQNGCSSPRITQLLSLYKMNATMTF